MKKKVKIQTDYTVYESEQELLKPDQDLLQVAWQALGSAYAPYSTFYVGAAARLAEGGIAAGANQENAAYPMCLCAERVALGNAAMQFPGQAITEIAIVVRNPHKVIDAPASPCGSCRQALFELEGRQQSPIRLLLQSAQGGLVYELESSASLLPLGFNGSYL